MEKAITKMIQTFNDKQAGKPLRHREIRRDNIDRITKGSLKRLARRAGVKTISGSAYVSGRAELKAFLEVLVQNTILYTTHAKRKTVLAEDVVHALRHQKLAMYGF